MQFKEKSRSKFRKDIQGLRALAVLAVILFHTNKEWLPGGFIGVDIFFVISGFLITSIILEQKKSNQFSFEKFYVNRIKRIVPAYYVLIGIVTVCVAILLTPQDFKFFRESLNSSLLFSSNNYFSNFGDYFAPNAYELPLLHTWSLAVEMQFYLFLPLLLLIIPTKYLKVSFAFVGISLMAYSTYEIFTGTGKNSMYFSLIARVPEFLFGSFLVVSRIGNRWNRETSNLFSVLGLLLIIFSVTYIDESIGFPGVLAIPACLGTFLIIASKNSFTNNLFSKPIPVRLGELSYSLYLWHWPILSGLRYYHGEYELDLKLNIIFIIFTLLFAYLSYTFIEKGFLSKSLGKFSLLAFAGIVTIVAIIVSKSQYINKNSVPPLAEKYTHYFVGNSICHGKIVGDCLRGEEGKEAKTLVIGDSHAAQLNLFFDDIGKSGGIAIKVVTASSCVTIPHFDIVRIAEWARSPCLEQIKYVQTLLPDYKKVIIAGKWNLHSQSHEFMNALALFLAEAQMKDINVIILAQIPMIELNPIRIHRFESLGLPNAASLAKGWQNSNKLIKNLSERYPNTNFIDFSETEFFERAPFYENELIYSDTHHLNEIGSRAYGAFSRNVLLNLLTDNR